MKLTDQLSSSSSYSYSSSSPSFQPLFFIFKMSGGVLNEDHEDFISRRVTKIIVLVLVIIIGSVVIGVIGFFLGDCLKKIRRLSEKKINLPSVMMESFHFQNDEVECVICLEPFEPNAMLAQTPCGHAFHSECLAQWRRNCPVCRIRL
uniref:RING finger protein 44 n=1 Tax=Noccaea caerulescens TaxID=107243 RepID=A0A1J3J9P9_NOCCA